MSSLKASRCSNYSPMRFLVAAQMILLGSLALYGFAVLLVMTPFIQTHVLFAHRLKLWGYSKFDHPEYYGLSPGKTVNVQFPSLDNTTLGGWFIFSDFYHQTLPFPPSTRDLTSHISKALTNGRPTILFMHGNTGTRALNLRIPLYTAYTSKFDANVFVIDYRGFGDSQGHPTVQGVSMDAKAAWDFLIARGARAQDILIVGHSLGTAISGILAAQLGREGVQPKGVVLMSPFSSVRAVIDTYALFGILPLLKPLAAVPLAPRVLTWSLKHKFDTLTLVPEIRSSVLLVHAEDDWDIPYTHSTILFEAFLGPHLPPIRTESYSPQTPIHLMEQHVIDQYLAEQRERDLARQRLVNETEISWFGNLQQFKASESSDANGSERKVAMLRTYFGGHDVGRLEGVQDVIGRMFDLF